MHGAYAANMAVSGCDLLFPSGRALMTGSRENCMNLRLMHKLSILISIRHRFSRNIHVDIPIVADAKEALTKMTEYVEECETKKMACADRGMERGASASDETACIDEPSGYY